MNMVQKWVKIKTITKNLNYKTILIIIKNNNNNILIKHYQSNKKIIPYQIII